MEGAAAADRRFRRLTARGKSQPKIAGPRQAHLDGFDLHANVWVETTDRAGLKRLCRYALRPPFAQERLRRRADGRVGLELKRAWHDGTRELVFEVASPLREMLRNDYRTNQRRSLERVEAGLTHLTEHLGGDTQACDITTDRNHATRGDAPGGEGRQRHHQSELLTRQWSHVDFQAGWIRLEPGETKNREGRMFPMTPTLRAVLERQRARTRAVERATGHVIPGCSTAPDSRSDIFAAPGSPPAKRPAGYTGSRTTSGARPSGTSSAPASRGRPP